MKIYLQSDVDAEKIMRKRGLGKNGAVQKFIADEVKRLSDSYVPMSAGSGAHFKERAQISADGKYLIYPGDYAHYVYVGEIYGPNIPFEDGRFRSPKNKRKRPTGRAMQYHDAPMRGKHWDKRMMADRKAELERSVEAYIRRLAK